MTTKRAAKQEVIEAGQAPIVSQAESGASMRTVSPQASASPLDLPAKVFRAGLDRRKQNREALMEWIRSALVEGVDYGRIHSVDKSKCQYAVEARAEECPNPKHWSKPSLFKPGAEKICGMLGVTVHYPTLHEYEQAALHGADFKHVILRCEIRDTAGRVVADGVGARSVLQDNGDINKGLKMAEKSAHVDATLRMAGLSEVFTQDLEDMSDGREQEIQAGNEGNNRVPEQKGKQVSGRDAARKRLISPAQHRRLEGRINELGLDHKRVKDWLKRASKGRIERFTEMTQDIYEILDAKLEKWARQAAEKEARAERKAIQKEDAL